MTINDIMSYAMQEEFCWQNNCDSITLETEANGTQVIRVWNVDYNTEEAKLANLDAFFA